MLVHKTMIQVERMLSEANGPHYKLFLNFVVEESPKRTVTTPETKKNHQSFIRKISDNISDRKIILTLNIFDFIMIILRLFWGSK